MKTPLPLAALSLLLLAAPPSDQTGPDQHQESADKEEQTPQPHPSTPTPLEPQVPLGAFQSLEIANGEALRAIGNQAEATKKQANAYKESWHSPSVIVQVGLLIVGALYGIFEYKDGLRFTIGNIGPGLTHQHRGTFVFKDVSFDDSVPKRIKDKWRFTICGLIEYREHPTDSPIYTTKFCLLWQGPEGPFVVSGPYNDCT